MAHEPEVTDPALLARALDIIYRETELAEGYDEELLILGGRLARGALSEEERRKLFTRLAVVLHKGDADQGDTRVVDPGEAADGGAND